MASAPCAGNKGYLKVRLLKNGKGESFFVHLLVIRAFRGEAPEGQECAHLDGVRSNASLGNLVWKTPVENQSDKVTHGTQPRGEKSHLAKLTEEQAKAIKQDPRTQSELARIYGVSQAAISRVKSGKRWSHL